MAQPSVLLSDGALGESSTTSAYRLRYIAKRADPRKYKEQAEQITDKVIASGKQPFRLSFTTAPLRVLPLPVKEKGTIRLHASFLFLWQGRKVSEKKTVDNCFRRAPEENKEKTERKSPGTTVFDYIFEPSENRR